MGLLSRLPDGQVAQARAGAPQWRSWASRKRTPALQVACVAKRYSREGKEGVRTTRKQRLAKWLPLFGVKAPPWLDGSLPGDAGFDPLALGRSGLRRKREVEVLSSRWAMLGAAALILQDLATAGRHRPALLPDLVATPLLPVTLLALACVGAAEALRVAGSAQEEGESGEGRVYPRPRAGRQGKERAPVGLGALSAWLGGLAGWFAGGWALERREMTRADLEGRKASELKLGRLAMLSFAGMYAAAVLTGKGPISNLLEHLSDPAANSVLKYICWLS